MDDVEEQEDDFCWSSSLEEVAEQSLHEAEGGRVTAGTLPACGVTTAAAAAARTTTADSVATGACHEDARGASTHAGSGDKDGPPACKAHAPSEQVGGGGGGEDPSRWRVALNTHKAGMQGLDKEHVNRIIYEASKDSLFYQNEMKKEKLVEERVARQQLEVDAITASDRRLALQQASAYVDHVESSRDLSRLIVHIDMDAFYAAVEILYQPELADKPMAVGSMGMLSTSNYVARKFGVRAGMPGFIGKKLCPDLVLVKSHFDRYRAASLEVRAVLADYDPDFEAVGLDESFLDITEFVEQRKRLGKLHSYPVVRKEPDKSSGVKQFVVADDMSTGGEDIAVDMPRMCAMSGSPVLKVALPECDSAATGSTAVYDTLYHEGEQCSATVGHNCSVVTAGAATPGAATDAYCPVANPSSELSTSLEHDIVVGNTRTQPVAAAAPQRMRTFGNSVADVLQEMIFRIHQRTGLTASTGVAANRRLAKIGSDRNKPNGVFILPNDRETIVAFMRSLPIRKVNGIGKVSERLIKALGIDTCGDLYEKRDLLWSLHTPSTAQYYIHISLGIGSSSVSPADDYQSKSVSVERTFRELSRPDDLMAKCRELCESLAEDVAKEKVEGKTVTLKLKEVTFQVRSRGVSFPLPVSSVESLFSAASSSLRCELANSKGPLRLRLMGVRLSGLQRVEKKQQLSLTSFMRSASANSTAPGPPAAAVSAACPVAALSADSLAADVESQSCGGSGDYSSPLDPCVAAGPSTPAAVQAAEGTPAVRPAGARASSAVAGSGSVDSALNCSAGTSVVMGPAVRLLCPVCKKTFCSFSNEQFNEHIDSCLNRTTIQSIVAEQSHTQHAAKGLVHASTPPSTQPVTAAVKTSGKPQKRRAAATGSLAAKKKASPSSTCTLDTLWPTSSKRPS